MHNGCPGFWPIEKRWREKRNDLAAALTGKSKEIADNILLELGPHKARTVVRALEARLQVVQNPHHDQTRRRFPSQRVGAMAMARRTTEEKALWKLSTN